MKTLLLYTTQGCHLCDEALSLLQALSPPTPFALELVEIAESDALIERYGKRIPVIQVTPNGQEQGWPFDREQALALLADTDEGRV